jgi:hypothetical protein
MQPDPNVLAAVVVVLFVGFLAVLFVVVRRATVRALTRSKRPRE